MVKASDINKDIEAISQKVGTATFAYEDIFSSKIPNNFHYDYKKVINEYARLNNLDYADAEKKLCECGILSPLPYGEYKIEVGDTTRTGGGINYNGEAFFSFSQKDYRNKYHELTHSLQVRYDLFNDETVQSKYDISQKGLSPKQQVNLLIDKTNYSLYLKEMHSESFAFAAMMLRATNTLDFLRQISFAYHSSIDRTVIGLMSLGKTDYTSNRHNAKFYATYPVIKATIKAVRKIRKAGKVAEFFDENGVINDEKLAKLCEKTVLDSAYSPRTLKAFFNYRIWDGHNKEEHGWRLDALKAVIRSGAASLIAKLHEGNILSKLQKMYARSRLLGEGKAKLSRYLQTPIKCDNPETQALKEYERLQFKILQIDETFPEEYLSEKINDKLYNMLKHPAPDAVLEDIATTQAGKNSSSDAICKQLKEVNEILNFNRSNPYFSQLIAAAPEMPELRSMIAEKQQNPNREVIKEHQLQPKTINHGSMSGAVNQNIIRIQQFSEKYRISSEMELSLLNTMLENPEAFKSDAMLKKLGAMHKINTGFLGIKNRQFIRDLHQLTNALYITHYHCQDVKAYKEVIEELKKVSKNSKFVFNSIKERAAYLEFSELTSVLKKLTSTAEAAPQNSEEHVSADSYQSPEVPVPTTGLSVSKHRVLPRQIINKLRHRIEAKLKTQIPSPAPTEPQTLDMVQIAATKNRGNRV